MTAIKINIIYILSFLSLLFFSCENSSSEKDNFKDCKYGQPTAIFSTDLPEVKKHQFKVKGKEGIELVSFANEMDLELIQSGCQKSTQDFNFSIPGKFEGDATYWVNEAIKQFQYLGNLGEKFAVLSFWGQAIEAKKKHFNLGQQVEVQPGFYVKINKVVSSDFVIITVKLFEK